MHKIILSSLIIATVVFTSCSEDNDSIVTDVIAPVNYSFNRNGTSSVSFSGQTTRIAMATEFTAALVDPTITQAELQAIFAHVEGDANFQSADLNASSKNIRSKTAASYDYFSANTTEANAIKSQFDAWISEQANEVFPNFNSDAVAGTPGKIQEAGGGSMRYVNAKGLELNQAIGKSLIGALMTDQILNNYLSTSVLDEADNVANNEAGILEEGKNYTTMEHKWDEAYGYVYGAEANPASPVLLADGFLNKYISRAEGDADFKGIAQEIFNAFKLGRAAIVSKKYDIRDAQAEIIRTAISKIIAIRAVYYLQSAKTVLDTDKAAAFHDLSEGFGFVYSLRFTRNTSTNTSYFTSSEISNFINVLLDGDGFWEVSVEELDEISNTIAGKFDFTVAETLN